MVRIDYGDLLPLKYALIFMPLTGVVSPAVGSCLLKLYTIFRYYGSWTDGSLSYARFGSFPNEIRGYTGYPGDMNGFVRCVTSTDLRGSRDECGRVRGSGPKPFYAWAVLVLGRGYQSLA